MHTFATLAQAVKTFGAPPTKARNSAYASSLPKQTPHPSKGWGSPLMGTVSQTRKNLLWLRDSVKLSTGQRYALCYLCKRDLSYKTATVDHVFPRSRGGTNDLANLKLACRKCNEEKGDKIP